MRKLTLLTFFLFSFGIISLQAQDVTTYLWQDMNANGIQDAGEPAITGVAASVELWNNVTNANTGLVAVEGAAGEYTFSPVPDGMYFIRYNNPLAGSFLTEGNYDGSIVDAGDGIDDSDVVNFLPSGTLLGDSHAFNFVAADSPKENIDAGFFLTAEIGDFVWEDIDGDGLQDGELGDGIGGLTVSITNSGGAAVNDANNVFIASTLTLADGSYSFTNLIPGDYIIVFDDQAPTYYHTINSIDIPDNIINDSDSDPLTGWSPVVTFLSGDILDNIDAGFVQPSSIGDFVWEDLNSDGIQDAGEPGLDGITISIFDSNTGLTPNDVFGNPVLDVTSGGGGSYVFQNLAPGTYYLVFQENLPNYYITVADAAGGNTDATDATNDSDSYKFDPTPGRTHDIIITSMEDNIDIDAGYVQSGSIGDFVWEDMNGDGLQDAGEPGLGGVTISIFDSATGLTPNDVFGSPIADQTTTGGGAYLFDDLYPGTYFLVFNENLPNYFVTKVDAAGGNTDATDATNDSDSYRFDPNPRRTHDIIISSLEDNVDIDAGYYRPTQVGDFVFHDRDYNGVFDNLDIEVPNITVRLFQSNGNPAVDVDNIDISTTTTDALGLYLFDNIPPGDYYIQGVLAGDWLFTRQDFPNAGANTDATDINNDSDADPTPGATEGFTHVFFLESNELSEDRVDIGIYKQIDVGGTVWNDVDQNCLIDGGENFFAAFVMELYDATNVLIDNTVTNGMGDYVFMDIDPGNYYILLVPNNFVPPLDLLQSSPCQGGDDDIDSDDNGDDVLADGSQTVIFELLCGLEPGPDGIENLTFDFGFFIEQDCDANTISEPACELLDEFDLFCDLNLLNGYCAVMVDFLVAPAPNPLCPGGGGAHNMSWFSFVAGTGNYEIEVVPTNCQPGDGGQLGVQTGIYTDCTFSEAVICDPSCSTAAIQLDGSVLTPGEVYYFFLDGCAGSVCDYTVNITGNFTPFTIPEPTDLSCDLPTCNEALPSTCPNADVVFTVEGLDLEVNYDWDIPGGVNVVAPNSPADLTLVNNITLNFPNLGTYTICMTTAYNGCSATSTVVCKDIEVVNLPDEHFLDTVCTNEVLGYGGPTIGDPNGDGVEGWQAVGTNFMIGFNTDDVVSPEGCEYTQTLDLFGLPISLPEDLDTAACDVFDIPMPDGSDYSVVLNTVNSPITFNGFSANGCDTTVNITAYILNIEGEIQNLGCVFGGKMSLVFNQTNISPNPLTTPDLTITYKWIDANGDVIPDDDDGDGNTKTTETDVQGTLTLEITLEIFGVECVYLFDIEIDIDQLLPPTSIITGSAALCDNMDQSSYTATNTDGSIISWNWTVSPPATIIAGVFSDSIRIDWNGSLGGDVCVSATNACGTGADTCLTVTLTESPIADFNLDTDVCIDSITNISFVGTSTVNTGFDWSFDGGIIQGGGSNTDEGPHNVIWNSEGSKMVILTITENGCPSIPDTQFIEVIELPLIVLNDCNPSTNGVEFSWEELTGATGYDVIVVQGVSGSTETLDEANRKFTVTGLTDGDEVIIIVVAHTNGPCGDVYSDEQSCIVQNCTPATIEITAVNDSICIDGVNEMVQTINATFSSAGVGTFSGNGIMDTLLGIFNADSAGVGVHTIRYRFVTDLDDCVSNTSIQVSVLELPTADFSISTDTICITDVVEISYTGNNTSANYIWNFGTDVDVSGNGIGPFDVSWSTPGLKTITLNVENGFCDAIEVTHTVLVEEELLPPNIHCGAGGTSSSVEFIWNQVDYAQSYDIMIDGVSVGNQVDWTYSQGGLNSGDSLTITVTAISDNHCPSVSNTFVCYATSCPTATFTSASEICITDSLVVDVLGTFTSDMYWEVEGAPSEDALSTDEHKIYTWTTAGDYIISLKTNKEGCNELLQTTTVTVGEAIEPIVIDCLQELNSITFIWDSRDCVTQYRITINGEDKGTTTDLMYLVENLEEGESVDIIVEGISDCICGNVITEKTCSANACPEITIDINIPIRDICSGDDLSTFTITATVSGDNSGTKAWGPIGIINNDGTVNVGSLDPGVYHVVYFYDLDACPYSETDSFTVHEQPVLFAEAMDPNCYKENTGSVNFNATIGTGAVNIKLDNQPVQNPGSEEGLTPGDHKLFAESDNGCWEDTLFIITPAVEPNLVITGESVIAMGDSTTLVYAGISSIGAVIDSVEWTSSEGILCDMGLCESISITPVIDDEYCVQIWYNDGCDIEECFRVNIKAIEIVFTNIFSPKSNDGNEVFNVSFFNTGHELKSMRIFDRWGNQLYTTKEIVQNEASWDGKFKGKIVEPGVYVYIIETVLDGGKAKVYTGDITVLR